MSSDGASALKRVLVVEDSPSDARLVRLMLEGDSDCRVEIAESLQDAERAIERDPPGLILVDLHLPDAAGLEAVEAAIRLAGAAPVVVLTGSDDETLALDALKCGAQDYVSKSDVNPKLLRRVLRHAVERHRLIRELREARERLEELSHSDPLTGLLNRRGLDRELDRERVRALRNGQTLHVIGWDVDEFKAINDREGHAAGDDVLIAIAQRALQTFRETDVVARVGGDEFVALLSGVRVAEVAIVAERLRTSICEKPFEHGGRAVHVTVSIGAAELSPEGLDFKGVSRAVDGALYKSKEEGKNRVSHSSLAERRADGDAPAHDGYHVAEPLLDPETDAAAGYELLLRPRNGAWAGPDEFFARARRADRLTESDLLALGRAVDASRALDSGVLCHVNLFPSTLSAIDAEEIGALLERGHGRRFCIDVSERQIVGDPSMLRGPLDSLRRMGHSIGVDHVGADRSSLESLLGLEPEYVKLDVRITRALAELPQCRRELRKLLSVVSSSGSTVVVARPESSEGQRILLEIGDDAGVQFLWSDPGRTLQLGPGPGTPPAVSAPVAAGVAGAAP